MADQNPGVYEPGANLTFYASAAVTSKTFLAITGNRYVAPGSTTTGAGPTVTGVLQAGPAAAAGRICGVAGRDTPVGTYGPMQRGGGRVTLVTAGAAITAGQEVEVGANALAVPQASGRAVGYAVTGAAQGADAEISLYY